MVDKLLRDHFRQMIVDNKLRISMSEMARVTGVSTSQLRYWERKGFISSKQDDKNKNHYFGLLTMFSVFTIKYFLDEGYTLTVAVEKEQKRKKLGKVFRMFIADRIRDIKQLDDGRGEVDLGTLTNDPDQEVYAVVDDKGTHLYCRPVAKDHD